MGEIIELINSVNMSFNRLKQDMLELIDTNGKISMYNQILLHHSDISDRRNYNPEKCDKIREKVSEMEIRYYGLKDKWFNT